MEQLYAVGVSCIQFVQEWFEDSEDYFNFINDLSNPYNILEYLFPLVSIVDSVFGAQFLLSMAFGGWLNAVMKWWLLEDRPYWWVRESTFYTGSRRPQLRQYRGTCETGPGSPSGHCTAAASLLLLFGMWLAHIVNDRKLNIWWWKYIAYPMFAFALGSVIMARLFVATHFPHQCLIGSIIGAFLSPALCIYVCDPFIWRYGQAVNTRQAVGWHIVCAVCTLGIAAVTYLSLTLCGWDPQWSVKLAFRWCENPEDIHVSTTPMFALVHTTSYLLGWALCVTPAVDQYRHYTKNRSILLSAFATSIIFYTLKHLQDNVDRNSALWFYAMQFILTAVKPALLLRLAPALAMWPYSGKDKKE